MLQMLILGLALLPFGVVGSQLLVDVGAWLCAAHFRNHKNPRWPRFCGYKRSALPKPTFLQSNNTAKRAHQALSRIVQTISF